MFVCHNNSKSEFVMLSEALQRTAKHEARLSNISVFSSGSSVIQRFFSRDCGIRMTRFHVV